jgi:hypothetical protein
MTVTFTCPSGTSTLASDAHGEGVSGLRVATQEGQVQITNILRAKEPRQRDRGNRLTVVSFQSTRVFGSKTEAEDEVIGLPAKLLDQTNATATLDVTGGATMTLHEASAVAEAAHFGCRVFYTVTLRGRLNA